MIYPFLICDISVNFSFCLQINKNYDDPEEVKFADAMRSMDLVIKIMEADGE